MSTPPSSVPDEASHFIRAAAVAHGEFYGTAGDAHNGTVYVDVPAGVAYSHNFTCNAFKPDITVTTCMDQRPTDPSATVSTSTTAGLNAPGYYILTGWPSLLINGDSSLYAMRLAGALVASIPVAILFGALTRLRVGRWPYLAVGAILTPMTFYLSGSVNPNGLEATSILAVFATTLLLSRKTLSTRATLGYLALMLISGVLLMSTRSISILWLVIALAVGLLMGEGKVIGALLRRPVTWIIGALGVIAGLATVGWYLTAPDVGSPPPGGLMRGEFGTALAMLNSTGNQIIGWIGEFGWLDTPAPIFTPIVWGGAILITFIVGFSVAGKKNRLIIAGLLAVTLFMPTVVQTMVVHELGQIWQGRYMLAMALLTLLVCSIVMSDARLPWPSIRRPALAVFALLWAAHVAAYILVIKRYSIGINYPLLQMFVAPTWTTPFGIPILALIIAFSLVLAGGLWLLWKLADSVPLDEDALDLRRLREPEALRA
ncbi:hypothetical protein M2390_001969 [Mycetocola sp. BIGb0189]|nr:hypothetical protein [Mycetocola sp. BIGb0189]